MKSAIGCGIKLREKLCSYVWLANPATSRATATPRRSAVITRLSRPLTLQLRSKSVFEQFE